MKPRSLRHPAEVDARRPREPSPPVVGLRGTDPPPLRPPGLDAAESIGFAASSAAVALALPEAPAEGWHLLDALALLWLAAILAAAAAHLPRASRRRWPWLPVGAAYATVAVAATRSPVADKLSALLAALS